MAPLGMELCSLDGDISEAPEGCHVVLEAPTGSLLHAIRLQEGLFALRGGRTRTFQVKSRPPAALLVRYQPPLGPSSYEELVQAAQRAQSLIGLELGEVVAQLVAAGGDERELAAGGEEVAAECLASFCVTGVSRCWNVSDACRAVKSRQTSGCGSTACPTHPSAANGTTDGSSSPASAGDTSPDSVQKASTSLSGKEAIIAKVQEKALKAAIHVGCRGPVAKVAGAAAAIGVEGYGLYQEVNDHAEKLQTQAISAAQYQERVCVSAVSSSGRAIGSLAGATVGQAVIPVPVVGALVGGVIGAAAGGLHANSVVRGVWRLSGGKAKGGDDLVRCVEHKPRSLGDSGPSGPSGPSGAPWPAVPVAEIHTPKLREAELHGVEVRAERPEASQPYDDDKCLL